LRRQIKRAVRTSAATGPVNVRTAVNVSRSGSTTTSSAVQHTTIDQGARSGQDKETS
jgi:hypothetical protein